MEEKTVVVPLSVLQILKSAAWLWSCEPIHPDDANNVKLACHKAQDLIRQSELPCGGW